MEVCAYASGYTRMKSRDDLYADLIAAHHRRIAQQRPLLVAGFVLGTAFGMFFHTILLAL